jgi:microcystin-dependent protein
MAESFLGEIRMFAGTFAPVQWAFCDGQLLQISQNDALYSLLSTTYGGDGINTFALPDMRGRIPIHAGSGPGLTPRPLGSKSGAETVTLTVNEFPSHSHSLMASTDVADNQAPADHVLDQPSRNIYTESGNPVQMDQNTIMANGGSQAHSNMMPFLCINFIISLYGIYPSRS